MAALDLSAVTTPGLVRKEALGNATEPRRVILPTAMRGTRGSGVVVSVYPITSVAYWVSPDMTPYPADTSPVFDPATETKFGICPADQWTTIQWDTTEGAPSAIALVGSAGGMSVYIAVNPARVPA